jgi:hypothetical protein
MSDAADATSDLGLDVLWQVFGNLMVDRQWSIRLGRGFAWWPHTLRQDLQVSEAFDSGGYEIYRITVTTDVADLADDFDGKEIARRLGRFEGVHGAIGLDLQDNVVRISSSMTFNAEQADWIARAFASYAILQAVEARQHAAALADALDGTVCLSQHPQSGPRAEPDDLLVTVVDKVFRAKGAPPSPWSDSPDFDSLADLVPYMGGEAERRDWGVAAELPFGDESCRFEVRSDLLDDVLGAGATLRLLVPVEGARDDAALAAFAFNHLELSEPPDFHVVGRWQPIELDGQWWTAYVAFIPAALHQPNVLMNLAMPVMLRSRWLPQRLAPADEAASG